MEISTKIKSGILKYLLMFVFATAFTIAVSATANADDWTPVNEAADLGGAGNYKLVKDIVINEWNVSGETQLDLNGYGIRVQNYNSGIRVGTNSHLTIDDRCETDRYHYITLSGWRGTEVADTGTESEVDSNGDGVVKVEGGYITGGAWARRTGDQSDLGGGGILVTGGDSDTPGGHVIMNAGTIIGNTVDDNIADSGGGGVRVTGKGRFDMNGGTITMNHSYYGGGVFLYGNGVFNHNGGTIESNDAANGGGVYMTGNYPVFNMPGEVSETSGKIRYNNAANGGGVFVAGNGQFKMTDGLIEQNTATSMGGGVYLNGNVANKVSGTVSVSGGTIKNNKATDNGGGIYYNVGSLELSGAPVIKDNTSQYSSPGTETANNVSLARGNKIKITGKMNNDPKIGVTRPNGGVFTTGLKDNGSAALFESNNTNFEVHPATGADEGEAQFGQDEWKGL